MLARAPRADGVGMIYPERVEPIVDFAKLTAAERHRSTMMGRKGKPDASNVMRVMIKFAHAASINEGLDIRQDHHVLTMRLFQFLCERTLWLYDCEYLWSRHRLSAQKDNISDDDLLAVAQGPSNTRLTGLDRVFANAADEFYYDHRLSDATWNAMRAYHPEAVADATGTYSVYVLMAAFANSVGSQLEEGVPGYRPELLGPREAQQRPRTLTTPPPGGYPTRLPPVNPTDYNQAQITALKPLKGESIANTKLMRSFAHFPAFVSTIASFILRQKACLLTPRMVHVGGLRTAWLYGCENVWAQERDACRAFGLSDDDIRAVATGPSSARPEAGDKLMVTAIDEMHTGGWLTDATWTAILEYGDEAPLDVIGVHALYTYMSTLANTLGVPLEDGASGFSQDERALRD
jgi:hypothetical protein